MFINQLNFILLLLLIYIFVQDSKLENQNKQ